MTTQNTSYRKDLDTLKGLAIIVVILYHMGFLPYGYLGVDVFFVINGYFILPKLIRNVELGTFNYLTFLKQRIWRLLPMLLLLSLVILIVGYWGMLPHDYEDQCSAIIATNFLSNNILAGITTKDYWAAINDYRALMHTWYIGILFEFYLVTPLILLVVKRLSTLLNTQFSKTIISVLILLSILSIGMYLYPETTVGERFYFLHYRFFELAIGGIMGYAIAQYNISIPLGKWYSLASLILLIILIITPPNC